MPEGTELQAQNKNRPLWSPMNLPLPPLPPDAEAQASPDEYHDGAVLTNSGAEAAGVSSRFKRGNGYLAVPGRYEDEILLGPSERDDEWDAPVPVFQRRKRSLNRCLTWTTILLIISLVLNLVCFLSRRPGEKDDDPDSIFDNWGRPGSGTEGRAWYPTDFMRDIVPVPCHSHNDYWRKVPLFSAIHVGCTGVEADVWLRDEDLLIGHEPAALQRNRTFRSLYVDPLVELLERNNPSTAYYNEKRRGIFDTDPVQSLTLLVDVKTDGADTWPWVMKQIEPLRKRGWLSYVDESDSSVHLGPVTLVGTGYAPFDQILSGGQKGRRYAFYDAPLTSLEGSAYNKTNSYYASVSFLESIGLVTPKGPSADQLAKIRSHVQNAHKKGLEARYWELPAWPIHIRNHVWQVLVEEGVDMLNVDDLKAAAKLDWTKF